jgi:hypothetical protein
MNAGEWVMVAWLAAIASCVVMLLSSPHLDGIAWTTAVKDLMTGSAALFAAFVAFRGLSTWERQLKGNAEFDCARGLARSTYALRDELQRCRSTMILPHEFPGGQVTTPANTAQERAEGLAHAYGNRWDRVLEVAKEFDVSSLEAEALWGPALQERVQALRACVTRVNQAIMLEIRNERDEGRLFGGAEKLEAHVHAALWRDGDPNNPFEQQLNKAVGGLEDVLRPHLRWVTGRR